MAQQFGPHFHGSQNYIGMARISAFAPSFRDVIVKPPLASSVRPVAPLPVQLISWLLMAWRFRKSLKLGPLRFNLSKSWIGTSIGVRGFRVGTDAKGGSYTAASIPGTGIYNRTYSNQGKAADGDAVGIPGTPAGRDSGIGLVLGTLLWRSWRVGGWSSCLRLAPFPRP